MITILKLICPHCKYIVCYQHHFFLSGYTQCDGCGQYVTLYMPFNITIFFQLVLFFIFIIGIVLIYDVFYIMSMVSMLSTLFSCYLFFHFSRVHCQVRKPIWLDHVWVNEK